MVAKPIMAVVMIPPNGCILDRPVHAFDLPVGPWMVRFGQAMVDVVLSTGQNEAMAAEPGLLRNQLLDLGRRPIIASGVSEMGSVVGQHGVDPVRNGVDQAAEEVSGVAPADLLVQFSKGKLAGTINGNEHVELTLFCPNLGDVDVEVTNRVRLELLLRL